MDTLGVGIIGCGNISSTYLSLGPLFRGFQIRAVADLDREAAEARAREFGVRAETVDNLLAHQDIDIAVNLTTPAAHFGVTRDVLSAGKHAWTEKPLVLSLEDGEALRSLSAASGLRVGSAPDTFLGGAHQQARDLIDGGAIGRVVSGTAHVMGPGMERWHPDPAFFFKPGAGPVLDMGPYYITNLVQLLGPVRRVGALSNSASERRIILSERRRGDEIAVETPTNIHALLEFHSGANITFSASWDVKAHRHGNMELYGTDGSLFLPDPNFFGGELVLADAEGQTEPVAPWQHPLGVPNEGAGHEARANFRMSGLADMVAAIATDRPHRCSLELAIHTVDVMNSILRSGESGEFVSPATTCERPQPLLPNEAAALMH